MADRPCDCLNPKSPLCSCQHCQWFCARWDAIIIRRTKITGPKRQLPNAYKILVTRYDQLHTRVSLSHGDGSLSANISQGRGCHPPTAVGVTKLEWLPFRVVSKYPQCIISFCHNTCVWQTDEQTDRQNCDSNTVRCITCSRMVKMFSNCPAPAVMCTERRRGYDEWLL